MKYSMTAIVILATAMTVMSYDTASAFGCRKKAKTQLECINDSAYKNTSPTKRECKLYRDGGLLTWSECAENPVCDPDYGSCNTREC